MVMNMDCVKSMVATICLLLFIIQLSEAGKAGNCSIPQKCRSCLDYNASSCFWCSSTGHCMEYSGIIPKGCKSYDWRLYYGNCSVPGYVWIIILPVVGLLILGIILCVICCYCCRCRWSKKSMDREETKFHRKRMELKDKHDERRAERKLKNDEIRKKYGLSNKDDEDASTSNKYQRFENSEVA